MIQIDTIFNLLSLSNCTLTYYSGHLHNSFYDLGSLLRLSFDAFYIYHTLKLKNFGHINQQSQILKLIATDKKY